MLDFEEKKKIRSILYSKVSLVVVALFLFLVVRSTWYVYSDEKATQDKQILARKELQDLKKREEVLSNKIINLQTPEGKEKVIRDRFRVAKKGEKMIMIVNPEDDYHYNFKEYVRKSFWSKIITFIKKSF